MKPQFACLAAALALCGQAASAEVTTDALIADYQAQGYTRIEVQSGTTQAKIEAIRGTEKIEVVLDLATGAILKSEEGEVGQFEDKAPGVVVRDRPRDFVRVSTSDDEDQADEQDDGDDVGDDDGEGHDVGDDDGEDDHGDDDHDGGDHDGGDHDGGDHDGGDHDGGDHDGGEGDGDD